MKKEKTMPKAANAARTVARKELERLRLRQVELLRLLSVRVALVAAHVASRQIPTIPAMTDSGVLMSIGETMMANQTLAGILGTLERIAKAATASRADIPAPDVMTTQ